MSNPLVDKDFLVQLDQAQCKEKFAKIIALDINENPIEQIEGRITGGSISVDGSSAVRRTCNLTMVASEININDFYWGLNTKVKIEIGIKNDINDKYPDIIWFKQGTFILTTFNTSISTNNYTITLNGKDKMCLLNGDVSGALPASVDFASMETYDSTYEEVTILDESSYVANKYYIKNKDYSTELKNKSQSYLCVYDDETITKTINSEYILSTDKFDKNQKYYEKSMISTIDEVPINVIIREAVHTYGKELYSNIIINDLEDCGLELLEYRGNVPLYLLYDEGQSTYTNYTLAGTTQCVPSGKTASINISDSSIVYRTNVDNFTGVSDNATVVTFPADRTNSKYTIAKIEYGQTAGYRVTDLTYTGELISNIGETLTSVLDKIKNMLGDFEYFYDVDGRFIWQKKKTYVNTSFSTVVETDDGDTYVSSAVDSSAASYSFEDNNLITAFSNTPAFNNLFNDFSIWGKRKGVTGAEIPIHLRYAIDTKPKYYKSIDGHIYIADKSIYDEILNLEKEKVIYALEGELSSFSLEKPASDDGLTIPVKNKDGSWSAGWWSIQDWARYYMLLLGTDEVPRGTMKFYSYGNSDTPDLGAVKLNTVPGYSYADNDAYCWLLVKYGNSLNAGHGSGSKTEYTRTCVYYETDDNGKTTVYYDEDGNTITKVMSLPYSGCNDTHTYLTFYNDDQKYGTQTYFYNPNFPTGSFQELKIQEIERRYEELVDSGIIQFVDWREIIYQMAKDNQKFANTNYDKDDKFNTLDVAWDCNSFLPTVYKNNILSTLDESHNQMRQILYPGGITGYEQYYIDVLGFWRNLYDPSALSSKKGSGGYYEEHKVATSEGSAEYNGKVYTFTVGQQLSDELAQLINYKISYDWVDYQETALTDASGADDHLEYYISGNYTGWSKTVVDSPDTINFWFDFLDPAGELESYSVPVIGDRTKVVNDNDVAGIYFRETANLIFISKEEDKKRDRKSGYAYVYTTSGIEDLFSISGQGKSAKDVLDTTLYNNTYCTESVTITAIPVYSLQPNTRIFVHDDDSKICGDYIVSKFTLPLTYNGTMSITATKAVERLY